MRPRPFPSFQPPVRHGTVERSSRSRDSSGPRRRSSASTYRRNAAFAATHSLMYRARVRSPRG